MLPAPEGSRRGEKASQWCRPQSTEGGQRSSGRDKPPATRHKPAFLHPSPSSSGPGTNPCRRAFSRRATSPERAAWRPGPWRPGVPGAARAAVGRVPRGAGHSRTPPEYRLRGPTPPADPTGPPVPFRYRTRTGSPSLRPGTSTRDGRQTSGLLPLPRAHRASRRLPGVPTRARALTGQRSSLRPSRPRHRGNGRDGREPSLSPGGPPKPGTGRAAPPRDSGQSGPR